MGSRYTPGDEFLSVRTLLAISPAVLPPHPGRIRPAGNETQRRSTEIDRAHGHIARRLGVDDDIAGYQPRRVGDGDQSGAREGPGIEIGDVGNDPCVVDWTQGIRLM